MSRPTRKKSHHHTKKKKKSSRGDSLLLQQQNEQKDKNNHQYTRYFHKIVPIVVQFAITWIIVVGGMKVMKSFGLLSHLPNQQGASNPITNNSASTHPVSSTSSNHRNIDFNGRSVIEDISNVEKDDDNDNVYKHDNTDSNVRRHKSLSTKSKMISSDQIIYPNVLNITTELQKLFHPVIKFPIRKIAIIGKNETSSKQYVKKQIYRVLDLTTMDGSSQLINPIRDNMGNDKQQRRNKRLYYTYKNRIQLFLLHRFSKNVTKLESIFSLGKYDEDRQNLYSSDLFMNDKNDIDGYDGARTIHMGIDLGGPVGTKVYSFWDGVVHSVGYNPELGDYGYVVIVKYSIPTLLPSTEECGGQTACTTKVWALYGHLGQSVMKLKVGQRVRRGAVLGRIGDVHENGGWKIPHVHFQLSMMEPETHDMPGAVAGKDRKRALLNYPDPRYILGSLY